MKMSMYQFQKMKKVDNTYEEVYSKSLEQLYEDIAIRENLLNEYINRQEGGRVTRKNKFKKSSQTRKIIV